MLRLAQVARFKQVAQFNTFRRFSNQKLRVLSGIQPTGTLHLGNYLGALRQWVTNQDKYDNFFCVVDLHAVTAPHDPKRLEGETLKAVALYLAAGLDPQKCTIFVQSHVTAHAELAWLLNCTTPIGWLERMTQFKDKARSQQRDQDDINASHTNRESVSMGLFSYPVLMAADILLYRANLVPVGDDQRQHLELARDIVRRFHALYCKKRSMPAKGRRVFIEPQDLIVGAGARVMSLQDGTSKMSKSDPSDLSRINLLDSPDIIRKKIQKCKTDSNVGMSFQDTDRAECVNLLRTYQAISGKSEREVETQCKDMNWQKFKGVLTEALIEHLVPIQQRYHSVIQDEIQLRKIIAVGAEKANIEASETLLWTKNAMGFCQK